jgi:cytohesin
MKPLLPLLGSLALTLAAPAADAVKGKPLMQLVQERTRDAEVVGLIDDGADVNDDGGGQGEFPTPLMIYSVWGRTEVVEALLKKGADVNYQAKSGFSALMAAAARARPESVEALLKAKPDLGLKDKQGLTALGHAARAGQEEICAMLVKAGADPEEKRAGGWTDLMVAVAAANLPAAKKALAAGDDLAAQSLHERATALHVAIRLGRDEMVRFLLDQKAPLDAKDVFGRTPLAAAVELKKEDLAEMIRKAGAKE